MLTLATHAAAIACADCLAMAYLALCYTRLAAQDMPYCLVTYSCFGSYALSDDAHTMRLPWRAQQSSDQI